MLETFLGDFVPHWKNSITQLIHIYDVTLHIHKGILNSDLENFEYRDVTVMFKKMVCDQLCDMLYCPAGIKYEHGH